jgi:superfamily II DNA or RNA helicase
MSELIELKKLNEVYFEVKCNLEQSYEIRGHFEVYVENYRFNPKYKSRMWNGKVSFFSLMEKKLPIGLLPMFIEFCKKFDYPVKFDFGKEDLMNDFTKEDLKKIKTSICTNEKYQLRDYQDYAVDKVLKNKRAILQYATGSGKSLILYTVIKYLSQTLSNKILIIVPSINLVQQISSDFQDYGWPNFFSDCGLIFNDSDHYDLNKKIVISTWQSLLRRPDDFFKGFGAVIVDECHGAKCLSVQNVLKKCVNASYRIGCSGSLPKLPINKLTLEGYIGSVVAEVKSSELIDKGVLSDIKIINVLMKYPENMITKSGGTYNDEITKTINYPQRHKALKLILDKLDKKQNSLILASRISHIKDIVAYLKKNYPKRAVYVIYGEISGDDREKIRKLINTSEGVLLVASFKTMSVGVNIPKLHNVIFASSYKAEITVLQAIGRGLRTHEDKTQMILWDLVDDLTWIKSTGVKGENYLFSHWKERKKIYNEQGFKSQTIEVFLNKL